jgi:hypothetical protein
VLGGSAVPPEDCAELHEHFVKVFGLDQGVVDEDGSVHFERQLVRSKEQTWATLAPQPFSAGDLPPTGFVAQGIEPGNGGARLTLTQTGPAASYLGAWRELIEALASSLAELSRRSVVRTLRRRSGGGVRR